MKERDEADDMGLLQHQFSKEFRDIVDYVYEQHFVLDQRLKKEYSDYQKLRMREDVEYNLSFLEISYRLNDPTIFHEYSLWLMSLMMNLMPNVGLVRMKEKMILHYQLMKEAFIKIQVYENVDLIHQMLDDAIDSTSKYENYTYDTFETKDRFGSVRQKYLDYLLKHDSKSAMNFIMELFNAGFTLDEIYIDIIQKVMVEVGQLWHRGDIGVAEEHFITVATQSVLSQFYPVIFSTPKKNLRLLSCSVGNELHEMGIRMISDLFEYHGWDTLYLGAAVPKKSILESIESEQPHVVALSVTMPQHLILCRDIVFEIKEKYPNLLVAVGGRAFSMTNELWKTWNIDLFATDARELIKLSEEKVMAID